MTQRKPPRWIVRAEFSSLVGATVYSVCRRMFGVYWVWGTFDDRDTAVNQAKTASDADRPPMQVWP